MKTHVLLPAAIWLVSLAGCGSDRNRYSHEGTGGAGGTGTESSASFSTSSGVGGAGASGSSSSGTGGEGAFGGAAAWSTHIGADGDDYVFDMIGSADGGAILSGLTDGGLDFGNGPITAGAYVAVIDAAGKVVWTRAFPDGGVVPHVGVAANGDVLVAGGFLGTMDLGTGAMTSYPDAGYTDVFVARLDGASGSTLWAKQFGGQDAQSAYAVAGTPDDGVALTGFFNNSLDFGTGPLAQGGQFVAKLDATGTGLWALRFDGLPPKDRGIGADAAGNVYIASSVSNPNDFGAGPLTPDGYDVLALELDAQGATVAAKLLGAPQHQLAAGIWLDPAGGGIIGIQHQEALTIGGATFPQNPNTSEIGLLRFDGSFTPSWGVPAGAWDDSYRGASVAFTPGGLAVAGRVHGESYVGDAVLHDGQYDDVFIMNLTSGGSPTRVWRFGSPGLESFLGVVALPDGKALATGWVSWGGVDLGQGPIMSPGDGGNWDILLAAFPP